MSSRGGLDAGRTVGDHRWKSLCLMRWRRPDTQGTYLPALFGDVMRARTTRGYSSGCECIAGLATSFRWTWRLESFMGEVPVSIGRKVSDCGLAVAAGSGYFWQHGHAPQEGQRYLGSGPGARGQGTASRSQPTYASTQPGCRMLLWRLGSSMPAGQRKGMPWRQRKQVNWPHAELQLVHLQTKVPSRAWKR